jgi:hypothetical protein
MARLQTNTINQSEVQADSILASNKTVDGAKQNRKRIAAAYPASPLLPISSPKYNPVQAFEELVLEADLTKSTALATGAAAYWGFDTLSRDYVASGKPNSGAPDVGAEVTQASGYGVGGPFTPQAASVPGGDHTGYADVIPVDSTINKTSRAPMRGMSADDTANSPMNQSIKVRKYTHDMFDSSSSGVTRQAGVLGSNSEIMPHPGITDSTS